MSSEKILVLGATGYIGGRLVPRLIAAGYSVRCLVRDLRKLAGRPWENVEIVEGDVLDRTSLQRAADGCSIVYYLIRAMGAGDNLPEGEDRVGAENMRIIAALVGVKRIIYLGGLGRESPALSPVLRSRREVGEVLASGSVPVTEFRAAMVFGSGSAFFDMMHALANRLPIIVVPRWGGTRQQPISTGDVLQYLVESLNVPESTGAIIDIGGSEVLSFKEMMHRFAGILDLRRWIVVLPWHLPRLSAFWLNLVTPISVSVRRCEDSTNSRKPWPHSRPDSTSDTSLVWEKRLRPNSNRMKRRTTIRRTPNLLLRCSATTGMATTLPRGASPWRCRS